jgi:hypothetical protein
MGIEILRNKIKIMKEDDRYLKMSINERHFSFAYAARYAGYRTSHTALAWNSKEPLCGCCSHKGYIRYMPFGNLHLILEYQECEAGNMCWCLNLKTLELTRHPIGVCPDGRYEWVERG